mmetsp:Transcript_34646/g.71521  ORF Transcript_34646/g.71521 Transcript_34646/m.71521 type:complete len:220 (+) Transcript_34646:304-963(+)
MAVVTRSRSLPLLVYSGNSSTLKHVCAVGSCMLSSPCLWITNRSFSNPPIGERSLPVTNLRSFFLSSSDISCATCQNHSMTCDDAVYPPSYLATLANACRSRVGDPHTNTSSSRGLSSRSKPVGWNMVRKPARKASNCALMDDVRMWSTYSCTYSRRLLLVTARLAPPGLSSKVLCSPTKLYPASNARQNTSSTDPGPSYESSLERLLAMSGLRSATSF